MSPRIAFALLLALAGCDGIHSAYLCPDGRKGHEVRLPKLPKAPSDPAAEASAVRALTATQKLLDANPSLGSRPMVLTLGSPKKSIFHAGNPQAGVQMYISQGLIDACKDEAQLAAVVASELGKIAAERAAQAALAEDGHTPIEERVGDDHGRYGMGDGTRLMEAGLREARRKKQPARPDPAALARHYLTAAGYAPDAMKQVAALLAEAGRDDSLAEQLITDRPAVMQKPEAKKPAAPPRGGEAPAGPKGT